MRRLCLVFAVAVAAGCAVYEPVGTPPERGPVAAPIPAPADETPPTVAPAVEGRLAVDAVDTLLVKGRAPKTGYSREAFGPAWADVDGNGCDTRNDVLQRDLTEVTVKAGARGCVVVEGFLLDPYSGEEMYFLLGTDASAQIHIDHVVSLSNAWQTGMFQRETDERWIFANDPLNLLAVNGSLNMQKRDGDAATWLPPLKAYRCEFVARQIAVKAEYQLWLTAPEKEAMLRILAACPGQVLPTR